MKLSPAKVVVIAAGVATVFAIQAAIFCAANHDHDHVSFEGRLAAEVHGRGHASAPATLRFDRKLRTFDPGSGYRVVVKDANGTR